MTDIAIGEMQPEPEPTAELEAAAPEAKPPKSGGLSDAPADEVFPIFEKNPEPGAPERVLPEIEYAVGATRQAILDEFLDADGGQLSMSQIKQALPNVLPGTIEACVRREWQQGRLQRISPGVYRLAPPKPAEPPKPPPPQPDEEAMWFEALEAWAVDRSWDVELGPPPDAPDTRAPPPIRARFADRLRKREERRAAAASRSRRQAEADAALREQLLAKCRQGKFDNSTPALVADDLAPIRAMLKLGVSVDRILLGVHWRAQNERLTTWRDERLLRKIGEYFWRFDIIPTLLAAKGEAPASSAAAEPDDDVDRGQHDHAHEPAGPHSLTPASLDVPTPAPGKAADASELFRCPPIWKTHRRCPRRT